MTGRYSQASSGPSPSPTSREDGVYVDELRVGAVVDIETQHRHYRLVKRDQAHVSIAGHPTFCPQPVEVEIEGSIGDKFPLFSHPGYIGRGLHLVYRHPHFEVVTTSRIREIHTRS